MAVPVNLVTPIIKGVPFPGGRLYVVRGVYTESPTSFTYQWQLDGSNISGAILPYYTVLLSQEGGVISCNETAINSSGSVTVATVTIPAVLASSQWQDADNRNNVLVQINSTFLTTDVDTSGNKINLTSLPLDRVNDYTFTKVKFSSTGTLPAPLVAGTEYYAENITGGFRIYPVATAADWASYPGFAQGETIPPALAICYEINPIVLTDTGSGTHTIYTDPLFSTIADKSGNNHPYDTFGSSYHSYLAKRSNQYGNYIDLEGTLGFKLIQYSEPSYGKLKSVSNNGLAWGTKYGNKRYAYTLAVAQPSSFRAAFTKRNHLVPSQVNAATGVFTTSSSNGHGWTTGVALNYGAIRGAFPTPLIAFGAQVFAKSTGTNTFTLHPTSADATAGTLAYAFTDTGSGIFYLLDPVSIVQKPAREILVDLCTSSNDHRTAPVSTNPLGNFNCGSSSFFLTGGNNGELGSGFGTTQFGLSQSIMEVDTFLPVGTVGPICQDTGTAWTTGHYWMTLNPTGSKRPRFHRTLANAQSCIGVATVSCSTSNMIKYGTLGSGTGAIGMTNTSVLRIFNDGVSYPNGETYILTPFDELGAYSYCEDFGDVSGNNIWRIGKNTVGNLLDAKTNLTLVPLPAGSAASVAILANSAEGHVPAKQKLKQLLVGSQDTDPYASVQMSMDGLNDGYAAHSDSLITAVLGTLSATVSTIPAASETVSSPFSTFASAVGATIKSSAAYTAISGVVSAMALFFDAPSLIATSPAGTISASVNTAITVSASLDAPFNQLSAKGAFVKDLLTYFVGCYSPTATDQNFTMYKGEKRSILISVKDETGAVVDLSSFTALYRITRKGSFGESLIEHSEATMELISDIYYRIHIDHDDTDEIRADEYHHELRISNGALEAVALTGDFIILDSNTNIIT